MPAPDIASFDVIADIKSDPKRGMYCLDQDEEIDLYGNERNNNHARLEIILLPCNYVHSHLGYEGDSVHPECIADLAKQTEYLGPLNMMLYYSEDKLRGRKYGDESTSRESTLSNTQVSETVPNWVRTSIMRNILSDETQLIQLGYSEEKELYKHQIENPKISSWTAFPTAENPERRYKFTSTEINFSPHLKTIYRQTYSGLDWLGDIGGLTDAMMIIVGGLTFPVTTFALKAMLLSSMFRYRESEQKEPSRKVTIRSIRNSKRSRSFTEKFYNNGDNDESILLN